MKHLLGAPYVVDDRSIINKWRKRNKNQEQKVLIFTKGQDKN